MMQEQMIAQNNKKRNEDIYQSKQKRSMKVIVYSLIYYSTYLIYGVSDKSKTFVIFVQLMIIIINHNLIIICIQKPSYFLHLQFMFAQQGNQDPSGIQLLKDITAITLFTPSKMTQFVNNKNLDVWVDSAKDFALGYLIIKDLSDRHHTSLRSLKKGIPYIFTGYTLHIQNYVEKMKAGKIYGTKKHTIGTLQFLQIQFQNSMKYINVMCGEANMFGIDPTAWGSNLMKMYSSIGNILKTKQTKTWDKVNCFVGLTVNWYSLYANIVTQCCCKISLVFNCIDGSQLTALIDNINSTKQISYLPLWYKQNMKKDPQKYQINVYAFQIPATYLTQMELDQSIKEQKMMIDDVQGSLSVGPGGVLFTQYNPVRQPFVGQGPSSDYVGRRKMPPQVKKAFEQILANVPPHYLEGIREQDDVIRALVRYSASLGVCYDLFHTQGMKQTSHIQNMGYRIQLRLFFLRFGRYLKVLSLAERKAVRLRQIKYIKQMGNALIKLRDEMKLYIQKTVGTTIKPDQTLYQKTSYIMGLIGKFVSAFQGQKVPNNPRDQNKSISADIQDSIKAVAQLDKISEQLSALTDATEQSTAVVLSIDPEKIKISQINVNDGNINNNPQLLIPKPDLIMPPKPADFDVRYAMIQQKGQIKKKDQILPDDKPPLLVVTSKKQIQNQVQIPKNILYPSPQTPDIIIATLPSQTPKAIKSPNLKVAVSMASLTILQKKIEKLQSICKRLEFYNIQIRQGRIYQAQQNWIALEANATLAVALGKNLAFEIQLCEQSLQNTKSNKLRMKFMKQRLRIVSSPALRFVLTNALLQSQTDASVKMAQAQKDELASIDNKLLQVDTRYLLQIFSQVQNNMSDYQKQQLIDSFRFSKNPILDVVWKYKDNLGQHNELANILYDQIQKKRKQSAKQLKNTTIDPPNQISKQRAKILQIQIQQVKKQTRKPFSTSRQIQQKIIMNQKPPSPSPQQAAAAAKLIAEAHKKIIVTPQTDYIHNVSNGLGISMQQINQIQNNTYYTNYTAVDQYCQNSGWLFAINQSAFIYNQQRNILQVLKGQHQMVNVNLSTIYSGITAIYQQNTQILGATQRIQLKIQQLVGNQLTRISNQIQQVSTLKPHAAIDSLKQKYNILTSNYEQIVEGTRNLARKQDIKAYFQNYMNQINQYTKQLALNRGQILQQVLVLQKNVQNNTVITKAGNMELSNLLNLNYNQILKMGNNTTDLTLLTKRINQKQGHISDRIETLILDHSTSAGQAKIAYAQMLQGLAGNLRVIQQLAASNNQIKDKQRQALAAVFQCNQTIQRKMQSCSQKIIQTMSEVIQQGFKDNKKVILGALNDQKTFTSNIFGVISNQITNVNSGVQHNLGVLNSYYQQQMKALKQIWQQQNLIGNTLYEGQKQIYTENIKNQQAMFQLKVQLEKGSGKNIEAHDKTFSAVKNVQQDLNKALKQKDRQLANQTIRRELLLSNMIKLISLFQQIKTQRLTDQQIVAKVSQIQKSKFKKGVQEKKVSAALNKLYGILQISNESEDAKVSAISKLTQAAIQMKKQTMDTKLSLAQKKAQLQAHQKITAHVQNNLKQKKHQLQQAINKNDNLHQKVQDLAQKAGKGQAYQNQLKRNQRRYAQQKQEIKDLMNLLLQDQKNDKNNITKQNEKLQQNVQKITKYFNQKMQQKNQKIMSFYSSTNQSLRNDFQKAAKKEDEIRQKYDKKISKQVENANKLRQQYEHKLRKQKQNFEQQLDKAKQSQDRMQIKLQDDIMKVKKDKNIEIKQLNNQLQKSKNELAQKNENFAELKGIKENLEFRIDELQSKVKDPQGKQWLVVAQLQKSTIQQKQKQINRLKQESAKAVQNLANTLKQKQQITKDYDSKMIKLEENLRKGQIDKLKLEHKNQVDTLDKQIESLKKQITGLLHSIKNMQDQKKKAERKLLDTEQKFKLRQEQLKRLANDAQNDKDNLQRKLGGTITSLQISLQTEQKKAANLNQQIGRLEGAEKNLKSDIQRQKRVIQSLKQQDESSKRTIQSLESQLQNMKRELQSIKDEKKKVSIKHTQTTNNVNQLTNQLEQQKKKINKLQRKIGELQAKVQEEIQAHKQTKMNQQRYNKRRSQIQLKELLDQGAIMTENHSLQMKKLEKQLKKDSQAKVAAQTKLEVAHDTVKQIMAQVYRYLAEAGLDQKQIKILLLQDWDVQNMKNKYKNSAVIQFQNALSDLIAKKALLTELQKKYSKLQDKQKNTKLQLDAAKNVNQNLNTQIQKLQQKAKKAEQKVSSIQEALNTRSAEAQVLRDKLAELVTKIAQQNTLLTSKQAVQKQLLQKLRLATQLQAKLMAANLELQNKNRLTGVQLENLQNNQELTTKQLARLREQILTQKRSLFERAQLQQRAKQLQEKLKQYERILQQGGVKIQELLTISQQNKDYIEQIKKLKYITQTQGQVVEVYEDLISLFQSQQIKLKTRLAQIVASGQHDEGTLRLRLQYTQHIQNIKKIIQALLNQRQQARQQKSLMSTSFNSSRDMSMSKHHNRSKMDIYEHINKSAVSQMFGQEQEYSQVVGKGQSMFSKDAPPIYSSAIHKQAQPSDLMRPNAIQHNQFPGSDYSTESKMTDFLYSLFTGILLALQQIQKTISVVDACIQQYIQQLIEGNQLQSDDFELVKSIIDVFLQVDGVLREVVRLIAQPVDGMVAFLPSELVPKVKDARIKIMDMFLKSKTFKQQNQKMIKAIQIVKQT